MVIAGISLKNSENRKKARIVLGDAPKQNSLLR